tara:strand:- start:26810 stop:26965 length:156 start_codon:yes stop_codon:yes gene_type:complete
LNWSEVLTAMDGGNAGNAGRSLPAIAPPVFGAASAATGPISGFVIHKALLV